MIVPLRACRPVRVCIALAWPGPTASSATSTVKATVAWRRRVVCMTRTPHVVQDLQSEGLTRPERAVQALEVADALMLQHDHRRCPPRRGGVRGRMGSRAGNDIGAGYPPWSWK